MALDKCLIHCSSLLCPLRISPSDTLMQRLLLSYAVMCARERVRQLNVNMLLVLWVVWAVNGGREGGWGGGGSVGARAMLSDAQSFSPSHRVSLGAPTTLWRGCRHNAHIPMTVLCWHGTAGHCPCTSATPSDISRLSVRLELTGVGGF